MPSRWTRPSLVSARGKAGGLSLLSFFFGLSIVHADVGSQEEPIVYGTDGRTDVYAESDPALQSLAIDSSLVLVPNAFVHPLGSTYSLTMKSLGSTFQLCPDQLFYDQPTVAYCSATLIDDDLVLTAGHCMTPPYDIDGKPTPFACGAQSFVFDFYQTSETTLATIHEDDVYTCRRIVVRHQDSTIDYAIVQLDRPVKGHDPAPVPARNAAIAPGTPITVIGSPSGIPLKIDDGAFVTSSGPSGLRYFVGNPDTFGGNSGSGVFDPSLSLVGVLVRGATDYRQRSGATCYEVNVVPDSKGAEEMTYVHQATNALCGSGYPSERLCGKSPSCGDGFCTAGETTSCAGDCAGPVCGDGVCEASEASGSCDMDCNGAPNAIRWPTGNCSAVAAPASDPYAEPGAIASAIVSIVALVIVRSRRRREETRAARIDPTAAANPRSRISVNRS